MLKSSGEPKCSTQEGEHQGDQEQVRRKPPSRQVESPKRQSSRKVGGAKEPGNLNEIRVGAVQDGVASDAPKTKKKMGLKAKKTADEQDEQLIQVKTFKCNVSNCDKILGTSETWISISAQLDMEKRS